MTLKSKLVLILTSLVLIATCLYVSASLQLRHESQLRGQAEQQLLMSLALMAEPYLLQNKVEQVKGHLLATSFSTTLPVKAILVYQADGNLFAATHFSRELFNFSPVKEVSGRKVLQDGSDLVWSAVMVTPASMSSFDMQKPAVEGSTLGYVALQISPVRLSILWIWQSLAWAVVLVSLVVLMFQLQRRVFVAERLQWQNFLAQLKGLFAAEPDMNLNLDPQETEFSAIIRVLSAYKTNVEQQKTLLEQRGQSELHNRSAAVERVESEYKAQLDNINLRLEHSQRQLKHWQQLCVLPSQQQAQMLEWLVQQEQLQDIELQAEFVFFPDWLAEQSTLWQPWFEQADIEFLVVEDPALSQCEVKLCAVHSGQLLKQIIALVLQDLQQNHLSMHINLQAFSDNKLLVQFDHAGHSHAVKQVMAEFQPDSVLASLCANLLSRLDAKFSVSALEGVGCSVRLELPLYAVSAKEQVMYQTAIFVDPHSTRSVVLKQSLYSVAEQVIVVQRPEQVLHELQHRLVDAVFVQLPEPDDQPARWAELDRVALRSRVLAFSTGRHLAYWQSVLRCPVLTSPLLSTKIRQQLNQAEQKQAVRLLVVDDNKTNLAFVKAMLSQHQIEVDTASRGDEAIQLAKSCRYQLILMDIQLPDISGVIATQMIRQLPQHQHTVILAFTAHAMPAEIEQFQQAGMDDVLIKPLDAQKAADLIRRCQRLSR